MPFDFDAAIVGSGFGGAVVACRLAEAGFRVVVLERGRRWHHKQYPSVTRQGLLWDEAHPEKDNGWLDFRFFGNIATVAGAGVGGGSLHYANISINARRDLFEEGWPPEIDYDELVAKYYPRVERMLAPELLPANQWSNRTKLLKEAAEKAGFGGQFEQVPLAVRFNKAYAWDASKKPDARDTIWSPNAEGIQQGTCVHLGQCDLGCPVEARNTLNLNYVPRAEKHGAQFWALHVVRHVNPREGGGYQIRFDRVLDGRLQAGTVSARLVVLSAGSIGSSELLLRCRDQHKTLTKLGPMLGKKWSMNGNYLSFALHPDHEVYPDRGPTISAAINFLGEHSHDGQKIFIEDGGLPDWFDDFRHLLEAPLGPAAGFRPDLKKLQEGMTNEPLRHLMLWFAQGRDKPIGQFKLKELLVGFGLHKWKLELDWDKSGARAVLDAIQDVHRKLVEATNGRFLVQLKDALITPHPLGGCPMGVSAATGVVDHRGAVFGYEDLYVADGSILPKPVGHNPSKTIAALSERIAEKIAEKGLPPG